MQHFFESNQQKDGQYSLMLCGSTNPVNKPVREVFATLEFNMSCEEIGQILGGN